MSTLTVSLNTQKIALSKLLWVGPLTILASVIANLIVRALALAVLPISPQFAPLASVGPVIAFTILGVLGAVVVFAFIGRFAPQPIRFFQISAAIVLVLSFVPDLALLGEGAPFPGATVPAVVALMVMHIVTGVIAVGMLSRFTQNA